MGLSRCFWVYAAALFVSSVVYASVDVDRSSGQFRLNQSSILVPQNSSLYPRPSPLTLRKEEDGLVQRVRYDVRSIIEGLPPVNIPSGGDLLITNEGITQAVKDSIDLTTICDEAKTNPLIQSVIDDNSEDWYCNFAGILVRRGEDVSGGDWAPSVISVVSKAQALSFLNDPRALERTLLVNTYTVRVPAVRDPVSGDLIKPPKPDGAPDLVYDTGNALPCSEYGITNAVSCVAIAQSDRQFGNSQWQWTTLFAASEFTYGNPLLTYHPFYVGTDVDPYTNATKADFIVVNFPSDYSSGGSTDDEPITREELDSEIESSYDPAPSDWQYFYNYLPPSEPAILTADSLPDFNFPPVIETVRDVETDDTIVNETTTSISYIYEANSVPRPELGLDLDTQKRSYRDGILIEGGDINIYYPPGDSPSDGSGGGSSSNPGGFGPGNEPFCRWADVICDFIDWVKGDPDDVPEDPDLSGLMMDPSSFEREFVFPSASRSCPEPVSVHISFVGIDVQISYEWWCELAIIIYPFVMLTSYVLAIYIAMGISRGD